MLVLIPSQPRESSFSALPQTNGSADSSEDGNEDPSSTSYEESVCDCGMSDHMCAQAAGSTMDFKLIEEEEREYITAARSKRDRALGSCNHGTERAQFSVAFSGGGVRAAAFQSGVLWRLGAQGLLQDMEYLAAVSGGGYVAASYTSHLHAAASERCPHSTTDLRPWYLDVVAKSICRMQQNAGNFVRDCQVGERDIGSRPRLLDLPILLIALAYTLLINPLMFVIVIMIPAMEVVEIYCGSAMRASFCQPEREAMLCIPGTCPLEGLLGRFSGIREIEVAAICSAILTSIFHFWRKCLAGPSKKGHISYLCLQAFTFFLVRITIIFILVLFCIYLVVFVQWFSYVHAETASQTEIRLQLCYAYIVSNGTDVNGNNAASHCKNEYEGKPWFHDPLFAIYRNMSLQRVNTVGEDSWIVASLTLQQNAISFWYFFFSRVAVLVGIAFCLSPFLKDIFHILLRLIGPSVVLVLVSMGIQFRVYAPLTGQLLFGTFAWDLTAWYWFAGTCLLLGFFVFPFQPFLRAVWHKYYAQCLQSAFFESGKDVTIRQVQENPWSPFLLLMGTTNDYIAPDRETSIDEISFSGLHTGSAHAGYWITPVQRSLARCTALSAAACLDAISLSMSNQLHLRFWLEILNLTWGDYVLFKDDEVRWLRYRLPSTCIFLIYVALLNWAFHLSRIGSNCESAKSILGLALLILIVMVFLSFFTFFPCLHCLAYDPWIRRFHEASRYRYRGETPPSLLYVTDGGVQDCTAVLQLMRRRCEAILLVLAAWDPHNELGVLKASMVMAKEEKLGSFYDLDNPKRDIEMLLDEYCSDEKKWNYLEVGIRYGWNFNDNTEKLGRLVVIRNQLPAESPRCCRPLLTEELIRGEADEDKDFFDDEHPLASMSQEDLGGMCCCDCCHAYGLNCGRKFPHLTVSGYLWLTPQLFNSLCRLGYTVSEQGIDALLSKRTPSRICND